MATLTGEFISATTANYEINQFLDIRKECYFRVMSHLQAEKVSVESLTYFSDTEISFIFDRALIEQLFSEIDTAGVACNALRVYYAADPDKIGSTTVVLVGANYTKTGTEVTSIVNAFSGIPSHSAIEYPGGGLRGVLASHLDIQSDNLSAGSITMIPL